MPRVLLTGFCAVPGPRRAGVQLRHVIRALTPMHNVDLLVAREGEQAYVERQGSVRVLRVPMHETDPHLQVQSFQRALKRQLDGADYDVVHCRDGWSAMTVLEARERMGYRVVYDLARSPLGESTGAADLDAQAVRDEEVCLAEADLVLAPTPHAVKALLARGLPPERVVLSPAGVDIDRFDWEEASKPGIPRILYLGSIDPGRGVRVLVRAMATIVQERDARLVLAGAMEPRFDSVLREAIRELGLQSKIEVLEPIDHEQLPALLASATVCVAPGAADFSPNPMALYPTKILEYMACRRAIVAPRRQTIEYLVEDGREALLFEPGDPVDLARKVLRLLNDPLLRDRLAGGAYERVRRELSASSARRAIRRAYDLLSERYPIPGAPPEDEAPKAELLADDDFEATVFEESPAPLPSSVDTALNRVEVAPYEDAEAVVPPPAPNEWAVTSVGRGASATLTATESRLATTEHGQDDDGDDDDGDADGEHADDHDAGARGPSAETSTGDDGTPIEGLTVARASQLGSTFVAGEIEVPTETPRDRDRDRRDRRDRNTPTGVSHTILGTTQDADQDTGSRTHRRS